MAPAATMVYRHQVHQPRLCLVLYSLNFIEAPFGNLLHYLRAWTAGLEVHVVFVLDLLRTLPESSSKLDNQTENDQSRLAVRERVLQA